MSVAVADAGGAAPSDHRTNLGRRAGRTLMLLMLPFVAVGAALTLSVYGAFVGPPLLAVSWVFRAGRRASRDPGDVAILNRLAVHSVVAGTLLAAVVIANLAAGWDDLDSAVEFASLLVGLAWTAGIWWVAADARRAARSP